MTTNSEPGCESPQRRSPSRTNFWIDLTTAVALAAMTGTGILQRWILPRGSTRSGLTWLGLDRHQWADFHFSLGVVLLVLVGVHLTLHWSWVRGCWSRFLGSLRAPLTWLVLLVLLALMTLPLLIPPERGASGAERGWQDDGRGTGDGARGRGRGRLGD